jgi:ssDNA-binding replication factor A large subunit
MLHMPISEIIKKISESAKVPEEKVKELIKNKTDSHNGLVSEEGAAHIVAHDLNVELFKTPTETTGSKMKIKDLVIGMANFEIVGKISQIFPIREFQKKGKTSQVGNFNLTDESGTMRIVLWDQKANIIKDHLIEIGQVIIIKNGNIKSSNFSPNGKELHITIRSRIDLETDEKVDVKIEPQTTTGATQAVAVKLNKISANQKIKAIGTIVKVYPPAFYDSCPQCGKKVIDGNCKEHNKVESTPAMVLSIILDDGTGAVRCTSFRNEAEKLSGLSGKDAKEKSQNPILIQEELDNALLGELIEIQGFVRENKQFDRTEITINSTTTNLNPVAIAKEMAKD